ncbi:MAG: hypothetical protein JSU73_12855 [candidate division WOR-3 bacterium]|nr:MAG: hypothetical protein JSU73_12855 [candidate division WOR-3 bacterium]
MHPDSANIIFTGGRGPSEWTDMDFAVSWSRDYGDSASWVRCELADTGYCYAVEFAPSNSSIGYAAGQVTGKGAVFRSTDIGLTWTECPNAPRDSILSIAIHNDDPEIVYAAANGLFRTTDAGQTWEPVELPVGNDRLRSVRFKPGASDTIVAGGMNGVVVSTDGGESWFEMNSGLDTNRVNWLEFADDGNCLIAATAGRSCYVWSFQTGIAGTEPLPTLSPGVEIVPNPGRGIVRVRWPGHHERVLASLTDIAGRAVWQQWAETNSAWLELSLPYLPPGIYHLWLRHRTARTSARLVRY